MKRFATLLLIVLLILFFFMVLETKTTHPEISVNNHKMMIDASDGSNI